MIKFTENLKINVQKFNREDVTAYKINYQLTSNEQRCWDARVSELQYAIDYIGLGKFYKVHSIYDQVYIASCGGIKKIGSLSTLALYSDGRAIDAKYPLPFEEFDQQTFNEVKDIISNGRFDDIQNLTPKHNTFRFVNADERSMVRATNTTVGQIFARKYVSWSFHRHIKTDATELYIDSEGIAFRRSGNIQVTKFGKIFKQLFKRGTQLPQVEVEKFSRVMQSNTAKCKMIRVTGDDLYNHGYNTNYYFGSGTDGVHIASVLWKSCMRDKGSYLDIYVHNEDVVSLVALLDDEGMTRARGLLWETPKGLYLDRVYYIHEKDRISLIRKASKEYKIKMFYDLSTAQDLVIAHEYTPNIEIELDTDFDYYPYMDTFETGDDGWLYNGHQGEYSYREINGSRTDEDHKTCYISGHRYHVDEMCYVESVDDWVHEDHCQYVEDRGESYLTDDTRYSDYYGRSLHENDVMWSDYHDDYIHEDDAIWVESEDSYIHYDEVEQDYFGNDHLGDRLMTCEHDNNLYHEDDMVKAHDGEYVYCDNLEEYEDENCKEECQHDNCMYYTEDMTKASDGEWVHDNNLEEYENEILELED